jgi:lactoylglutathione lyase
MNPLLKTSFPKIIRVNFWILIFALALPQLVKAQSTGNANQPVFNHFALCAKDLKKTADFYRTVIQLKEIHHPFNDTVHVWLKIGEGLALHIIKGDCPQAVHNIGVHLCFSVPNLDLFIHHLDDMHITYGNWGGEPKKIQLRADGVKQIYLQDPDSFWVEVNDAK